jgi:uncharacterized phiE125 gp8 family phage protein
MPLKLITAATEEPVPIEEFLAHARIDSIPDGMEEVDLLRKLKAARLHVERNILQRVMITSTWEWTLSQWPYRTRPDCPYRTYFDLPLGNLQSITYVKYTDSAGVERTMDAATYRVTRTYDPSTAGNTDAGIGRLYLRYGQVWPSEPLESGEAIRIRFVAGWKDAISVPDDMKLAVEMLAAYWYRTREPVNIGNITTSLAMTVTDLCSPYMDRPF